ncbi:MAG: hypothetical protein R3Y28_04960 [Candidatus Gastranaerophilales bacterium]
MKKVLTLILLLILSFGFTNISFAESDDPWDDIEEVDLYKLKRATDEEFEEAYEAKKGQQNKSKKNKKGNSIQESQESVIINSGFEEVNTILIPAELKSSDGVKIPIGHYRVYGESKDGEAYLVFYQSHHLVAKIHAEITEDDFRKNEICFIEMQPYSKDDVRIIFGSMEFNAFTFLTIVQ